MNSRIRISSDGSLDACPIDKFSAAALDFNDYRNCKPVIITDSSLTSVGLSTLVDGVDDVDIDVLVAKDGKNFLKHELCTTKSIPSRLALETILCGSRDDTTPPHSEYPSEEMTGEPETSSSRMYARMYLDKHPRLRQLFDLSSLRAIVSAGSHQTQKQRAGNVPTPMNGVEASYTDSPAQGSVATTNDHGEKEVNSQFKDKNIGLWVSSQGCATPLHFDLCHGFLAQIVGRKTFILAPADDSTLIHYWLHTQRQKLSETGSQTGSQSKNGTTSPVDFGKWLEGDKSERQKYNRIDEVGWYIAQLSPGDVLYTPPGWWHYVVSETVSVSLLVPFDPNPDSESLPANVLMVG
jgi:Cupin-like domain